MSRADTTAMLSELVEKRLKNQTAFWASEVNFDRNTPDYRRVDYVGFKPLNVNGEPVPASVEKGCFGFYEVKSCMADFTSGNGLTFYGDQNYLVCTKELCDEIVTPPAPHHALRDRRIRRHAFLLRRQSHGRLRGR